MNFPKFLVVLTSACLPLVCALVAILCIVNNLPIANNLVAPAIAAILSLLISILLITENDVKHSNTTAWRMVLSTILAIFILFASQAYMQFQVFPDALLSKVFIAILVILIGGVITFFLSLFTRESLDNIY